MATSLASFPESYGALGERAFTRGVHTPNLFSFDSPAAAQKGVVGNGHGLSVGMDQTFKENTK